MTVIDFGMTVVQAWLHFGAPLDLSMVQVWYSCEFDCYRLSYDCGASLVKLWCCYHILYLTLV